MDDDYAEASDDAELLEKLEEGLYDNFDWLVRKYKDPIFKVAYNMLLRNRQDANDVTQKTFLKAWLELQKIKEKRQDIRKTFQALKEGQDIRLRSWLFKIVRNECINHWRDERRLKRSPPVPPITDEDLVEDLLYNQGSSAEDEAIQRENNAELYNLLGQLPKRQREIIILYHIGGLSDPEITGVLKRKLAIVPRPDAIKKARQRALKTLQAMVASKKSGDQIAEAPYDEYFLNSKKENIWNKKATI